MRVDVRLTGIGGQGLLWMASTLAVAATRYSGLHATQSASYASAIRGGYSRGDVVLSDEPIDYPWLISADLMVAMAHPSFQRDLPDLNPQGQLLLETTMIRDDGGFPGEVLWVPAVEIAGRAIGSAGFAGVVMLGVLDGLLPCLRPGSLAQATEEQSPPGVRQQNVGAYEAGKGFYTNLLTTSPRGGHDE